MKIAVAVLLVGVFVASMVIWWLWAFKYKSTDVEVLLQTEIESAIAVKEAQNKIVKMETIQGLFGAGVGVGVGMGAPQITAYTAEQFSELVAEGEKIYVSLELPTLSVTSSCKSYKVQKVYMAFIEDRAGVMIYRDVYFYKEGDHEYWIVSYDWEKIIFHWDNKTTIIVGTVVCAMLWLMAFLPLVAWIYEEFD